MHRRWWIMMALLAVGLLSVSPIRNWLETRGPKEAVTGFLEALKAGDEVAAVWWIHPDHAQVLQSSSSTWRPSPRITYRIEKTDVLGAQATVEAIIREAGFSLKAAFKLEPDATGRWRISEVEQLQPDETWDMALKQHKREVYARELKAAADRSPGVIVEIDTNSARR